MSSATWASAEGARPKAAALEASGVKYVIRLNVARRPTITDEDGQRVELVVEPGKKVLRRNVTYLGRVRGNLAGYWAEGLDEPVWVFSNLEPEKALEIYRGRMKIEQSFRDLKGLLGLEKAMPKKLENLEKLIAFMLLAYAVGLLVGETIRAELHEAYSGLFILLKHRLKLRLRQFLRLIRLALDRFRAKRLRRLALSYLLSEGQKAPCPERFPCKESGG